MKFKTKSVRSEAGPILVIEAEKGDELAYVDAERVYRGDLDSFLPFTYGHGGKAYEFSYYLGSGIALDRLLAAPVSPELLRNMLGSLLHMMQVCERSGLSRLRVVSETEHVYYDPAMGMLRFAYIPIRGYVSEAGEAGLISRICSAPMADEVDAQFAVSVWDFVHRTSILTSVALEDYLEEWGLQTPGSGKGRMSGGRSVLGADTRDGHGWDFVTALREEEARRKQEAAAKVSAEVERESAQTASRSTAGDGARRVAAGKALCVRLATGAEYALHAGRNVLGRSADCAVAVPDSRSLSRKHAELDVTEEGYTLRDLNSTNGTFVDGARLDPGSQVRLKLGSSFSLGEEAFLLR